MSFLVSDMPWLSCYLRAEYLYNLESHHGEFVPVVVFGITSIHLRAIGFNVMLDNGAKVNRLPITALCWKTDAPVMPLDHLQLWDCFSYNVSVHEYSYLRGLRVAYLDKSAVWHEGNYIVSIDWAMSPGSESAGEVGYKTAEFIQLDNGNYSAQPNNRLRFWEAAHIVKPFPERPDYKVMNHIFRAESKSKWATNDDDRFFYDIDISDSELRIKEP